jgi:hypothetical protein
MPKGISISVASDTRDFTKGIKSGVIEPLDDVQDALKDAGKAGDKAGDQLQDAMKDAQRQTEKLEKAHDDLNQAIQRGSSKSSRAMSDDAKKAAKETNETMDTVKESATSNLGETLGSFDGTAQGFVDGLQGLFGDFAQDLGPAGIAIGAAGGIAIGLISKALGDGEEATEEYKQKVSELTSTLIDSGTRGAAALQDQVDALKDLASNTDDPTTNLAALEKAVQNTQISFRDLASGLAGTDRGAITESLKQVNAEIKRNNEEMTGGTQAVSDYGIAGGQLNEALSKQQETLTGAADKLKEAGKQYDAAAAAEKAWVDAGGPELQAKADATASYVDSIASDLSDAGADWEDYATKEGGLDLGAYIAAFQAKADAMRDYQANMATASHDLNQDALNYISSLGTDAAPLLAAFVNAPLGQKQQIAQIWSTLGAQSRDSYQGTLNGQPVTLTPSVNLTPAEIQTRNWINQQRTISIDARVNLPKGVIGMGAP